MREAGRSGNVGRKKPLLRGGRGDRDVRLLVVQPTVFREEQFVATIRLFVDTSTETWLLQPCLPSCVFALALVCACFLEQTSHTPSSTTCPKGLALPPPPHTPHLLRFSLPPPFLVWLEPDSPGVERKRKPDPFPSCVPLPRQPE